MRVWACAAGPEQGQVFHLDPRRARPERREPPDVRRARAVRLAQVAPLVPPAVAAQARTENPYVSCCFRFRLRHQTRALHTTLVSSACTFALLFAISSVNIYHNNILVHVRI